jgi:hypothetical protein
VSLTPKDIEYEILYRALTNMGNFFALNISLDPMVLEQNLVPLAHEWKHYNPRKPHIPRQGLSLTSLDGGYSGIPDLDSIREYNIDNGTNYDECSFRTPTEIFERGEAFKSLRPFFPHLGRSHLIRLNQGGYFPFHRDNVEVGIKTFRLIALLKNCGAGQFCFLYDNGRIFLEQGILYFLNTNIEHALMSFGPEATLLVLNVILSKDSVRLVMDSLKAK